MRWFLEMNNKTQETLGCLHDQLFMTKKQTLHYDDDVLSCP